MNKTEFVNVIAESTSLPKSTIDSVITKSIEVIEQKVAAGEKVSFAGFGSFEPKHRAARPGINLQTKEKITIPAKTVPSFKAGKTFKDKVSAPKKGKGKSKAASKGKKKKK